MDLKKIRKNKGLTQVMVADAIGRDRSLIAKIENGKTLPSVETAKMIAATLNFDWTCFYEDSKNDPDREVI